MYDLSVSIVTTEIRSVVIGCAAERIYLHFVFENDDTDDSGFMYNKCAQEKKLRLILAVAERLDQIASSTRTGPARK